MTGAKLDQATPRETRGYGRPGWAALGLVGRHSRTKDGQFGDVACLTHERSQGAIERSAWPRAPFRDLQVPPSGRAIPRPVGSARDAAPWYPPDVNQPGLDAYKIVLYRQDDAAWVAEVPAISGCYALMTTREEALAELGHVFDMIAEEYQERGAPLPKDTTEIVNA